MNVIDALFVTLGLDTRDYEKKQKEVTAALKKFGDASQKQTKLIAESGKKAAGAFSALKIEVLGALAAFGVSAGFKDFIQSNMNGAAAVGRMSDALGVSVDSLQTWKQMAVNMGESGDAAVATLQKVSHGMAAARRGDVSFLATANRYGAGLTIDDTVESTMSKLNKMAYAIKQKFGGQQAVGVLGELGIGDLAQQTMLMESPAQFAKDRAEAQKESVKLTQKEIEQAKEMQKRWGELKAVFGNIENKLFMKLEPVVLRLGKEFADWLEKVDWDKVISSIGRFIVKVQQVVHEMGGWKTVAEILGGILALKVLSPVLGLVGGLLQMLPLLGRAAVAVGGLSTAFAALGVAIAGASGAWIGSEIWKHLLEGTTAGDKIGEVITKTLANLGYQPAIDAVNQMEGKGPVNHSGDFHPERTAAFKDRQAKAMAFFMAHGWSQAQAAGIVGNLMQESSLNPNAVNPKSGATGLAQWLGDRAKRFQQIEGVPLKGASFEKQLDFINYELHNTERRAGDNLRKTKAAANAALVFGSQYERFGNDGSFDKRIAYANIANAAYVGAPRVASSAQKPASTNTVTINGPINVQTKATDADGVAKGMKKALQSHPLIAGYVTVLN